MRLGRRLRGLIAPHIDFHRGGPTYAWAYRALLERSDADLFVILGTCHGGMADPFTVTLKPYDTPLGPAEVDRGFFEALQRRYRHDLLASETAHRSEHSIEFQAVMLRRLLGDRPFTILPVLASFLHEAVWTGGAPEADPRVPRFLDALGESIAGSARKVCVIAGVDLAHVGPRFGDAVANTPAFLERVAREDRKMLESGHRHGPRGILRVRRGGRRQPAHLRALADLRLPARAAGRARRAPALQPVARPAGSGQLLRRGVFLMASSDPSTWKLPRLRIDRDGGWFHEGEEVCHEGILASLRQGLQVDAAGHFLQIGPVRVPVEVEDAPFAVVRFEADGDWLRALAQ